ncbi:MAG: hypothetical protein A2559_04635 [Deltaproteobacteria bacterium RIFOXYD2_FULL_66_9]|nr:MAG: hypothetical protein A2559_04635 [Deltaproteobacteria bacterium RIFOXYD2_FULL_66_9]
MYIVPGLPKGETGGEQEILLVIHDQDPFWCFHGTSFGAFLPGNICKSYSKRILSIKIYEFSRIPANMSRGRDGYR